MTRKTLLESIRLIAGLSALAIASAACAPVGSIPSDGAAKVQINDELQGPVIDESVELAIATSGEARVHIRAIPAASGMAMAAASAAEIPPEIISLLARLPEGSFRVEGGVEGQPEALGILTREGLAALRYDRSVEFVAQDRIDDLIY